MYKGENDDDSDKGIMIISDVYDGDEDGDDDNNDDNDDANGRMVSTIFINSVSHATICCL